MYLSGRKLGRETNEGNHVKKKNTRADRDRPSLPQEAIIAAAKQSRSNYAKRRPSLCAQLLVLSTLSLPSPLQQIPKAVN